MKAYNKYNRQYKPENALVIEDKLKDFDPQLLQALLQEIKSTKNGLLIEQKRYSDPIEIAYRDGAIITIDIIINKIRSVIASMVKKDD